MEIKYGDYEKISDDLCYLDRNTILKFNVSLAHKNKEGERIGFHSEIQYNSSKYHRKVINIKRHFDFFLSFENIKPSVSGIKEFIMIRTKDILDLRFKINKAFEWFTSQKYSKLYAIDKKNNKLIMLGKVEPVKVTKLCMDKYIAMEPIIYEYENSSSMGVRFYLSSPNNYVDMPVDNFSELKYLIDNINMYESAQLLLNYIQRPAYGTDLFEFQTIPSEPVDGIDTKAKNRVVKPKSSESFFNKLDNLVSD